MSSSPAFEPDFSLTVSGEAQGPVISVVGELDSGTCDELLQTFRSTLGKSGEAATVTLDLGGVSFIDSAGTRTVIMIEREARDGGISLALLPPAEEVTELLRTAGVIERLELQPMAARSPFGVSSMLERIELELPRDPHSPARARAEVRQLLDGHEQTHVDDVVLLTSEIVTNAVVHPIGAPEGTVGLRIFTYPEGIRVEVDDEGVGFDVHQPREPQPYRGRGLFLVDRFSSRWGTEHLDDERGRRFMVWFELQWQNEDLDASH